MFFEHISPKQLYFPDMDNQIVKLFSMETVSMEIFLQVPDSNFSKHRF